MAPTLVVGAVVSVVWPFRAAPLTCGGVSPCSERGSHGQGLKFRQGLLMLAQTDKSCPNKVGANIYSLRES